MPFAANYLDFLLFVFFTVEVVFLVAEEVLEHFFRETVLQEEVLELLFAKFKEKLLLLL